MRLGQMSPHRLGVIARTSSMAYKQTKKSVAQIGQELRVEYVLEGSVRRDADRIRITAQLVRTQDQVHLWADTYDRRLPGLLEIHGEIGAAIAAQVNLKLMLKEREQLTRNAPRDAEAHDHYLRGRYHHARPILLTCKKPSNTLRRQRNVTPPTRWRTRAWPIPSSSSRFQGTLIRRMSVRPRRPLRPGQAL